MTRVNPGVIFAYSLFRCADLRRHRHSVALDRAAHPPSCASSELRIHRAGAQLARGILFAATTLLLIMSLGVLPLVNVFVIVFASPLIVPHSAPSSCESPRTAPGGSPSSAPGRSSQPT